MNNDVSMTKEEPTVLVVEDESSLVEIYAHWLRESYSVRTAENGEEALKIVDSAVDIMILDRLMPGMTGEAVVDAVRERGLDCQIVMATAVESNFDLIEEGADASLMKPITKDELLTTVSQLYDRGDYLELEEEYFDLLAERATSKANMSASEQQTNEEYADLEARIETIDKKLTEQTREMDDSAFVSLMRAN